MNRLPLDFIATLYYKTPEEGGRETPACSGYRPDIKFPFDGMYTCGIQTFIDREKVYPGETVDAQIKIISVPYFAGRLEEGMEFIFVEGANVIGTGIIKEIVNEELRKLKDSPVDMTITEAPLTPRDIQVLKDSYSFIMRRFGKVSLYMLGAMAVVYLLPILFGDDKFNLHTLKVFLLFFVLLPFIIYVGVFVYFAPYKLWLDIRRNKKKVGIVQVKKVEGLDPQARKDLFGMFDFKVTFEKEPFGLKPVIFASSLQPDLLKYKKFRVEIAPLSKKELKFEPVK